MHLVFVTVVPKCVNFATFINYTSLSRQLIVIMPAFWWWDT